MSDALNLLDWYPVPFPSKINVRYAHRGYRTNGALSPGSDRARSGNEKRFIEMVWNEISREQAAPMVADLEYWGTQSSFLTTIGGENLQIGGGAADADLDKLLTLSATGSYGPGDLQFHAHTTIPQQIVRNDAGSFITEGFRAGMTLVITNAAAAANNNSFYILSVAAATIDLELFSPGLTAGASDTTATLSGSFDNQGRILGVYTNPSVASTLMIKKGSFIGFAVNGKNELLRVQRDFTTDANGEGAIYASQYIRDPPDADTVVYTRNVPIRVTLVEDPGYQLTRPILYQFSIRLEEEPLGV